MVKVVVTNWECDAPACSKTEVIKNNYAYMPPKGWSTINVSFQNEEENCECQCHLYEDDWEEGNVIGWHEEDDCECYSQDEDQSGEYTYCDTCTDKFKMNFVPRVKKGGLL